MTENRNIEDIYRLTELQEAVLVHRRQRGEADTGVLCVRGTLVGDLDVGRFTESWRRTLSRHPAARSSVHWQDLKHPVQVVSREVDVSMNVEDLSAFPPDEQRARLAELERRNREWGLDIGKVPVMRWTVARLSERRHRLLWLCHHLLLDGWSSSILLNEVLRQYRALARGEPFDEPPPPRFRDWVAWLREHDDVDPAGFWRRHRFRLAEPFARSEGHDPSGSGLLVVEHRASLSAERLDEWGRRVRVTPASLFVGGWSLVLGETTGTREPVFGFTASGRSADFDGIGSLVGMLANTVPFLTSIEPSTAVDDWFRGVADTLLDVQRYERRALGALLRAGGFSPRRPMFDSLLAYANYPGLGRSEDPAERDGADSLQLRDFESDVTTGYPLTLAITPDPQLTFRAHYVPEALARSEVERILSRFDEIVRSVVAEGAGTIGDLVRPEPWSRRARAGGRPPAPAPDVAGSAPEAPGTPVENQLQRIWLELLEVPEIGLDQNFFSLGVNSVVLPKMIERVRQDFGVELALGVVFESPTVREMARIIESGNPEHSWPCLVTIRESGRRPPLYLMHGLTGGVGRYYDLANWLPPDQPVFGLQAPAESLPGVPAMAARYLEEIRRHQPRGPYHLSGFCIGGILAFEMARQLSAAGERVALLALLDSLSPGPLFTTSTMVLPPARTLGQMLVANPRDFLGRATERAIRSARRLGRTARRGATPVELDEVRDMREVPPVYYEPSMRHFRAARDYDPDPWPGNAWLLRTVDDRFPEDLGWRKFIVGQLRIATVPGHHSGAFEEPHIQELGRRLASIIVDPASPN